MAVAELNEIDVHVIDEAILAERDAALDALRDVLAMIDRKAYKTHEQQLALWRAEALLAGRRR